MNVSLCPDCGARVLVVTFGQKTMPLDADPNPAGLFAFVSEGVVDYFTIAPPGMRYATHWATCRDNRMAEKRRAS